MTKNSGDMPGSRPHVCPICLETSTFKNTNVAVANGHIYTCGECSGYFLFPKVDVDYNDSGWTQFRQKQWIEDVKRAKCFAPVIIQRIERELSQPVRSVLEIGCGNGFMGMGFTSASCSYTGIDVDQTAVDFGREKGLDVYFTPAENIDSSPISSRTYDLILSSNAFEHLDRPLKAFENLSAISSGAILIIVPNPHGLFAKIKRNGFLRKLVQLYLHNTREIIYTIDGYWHSIAYSQATLKHLCRKARLQPLSIKTISINHPVYGFVQPNKSLSYRFASSVAALLGMDSELLLIARSEK